MAIRQTGTIQTASQDSHVDEIRARAEAGDARAQHHLGLMHHGGHFVTQDYIEAWKWFSLATDQAEKGALAYREGIAARMPPEQIADAKKRAAAFIPKKNLPKD